MELEKDGSLPFLDTILTWREDGSINMEVYYKTTNTDKCTAGIGLWYTCQHSQCMRSVMVSCLFNHVWAVYLGKNVGKEKRQVTEVLKTKRYPKHIIRSAKRPRKKRQEEATPMYLICLLCVLGLSETWEKYARRLTLGQHSAQRMQLTRFEHVDPLLNRVGEVCRVPGNCGKECVGQNQDNCGEHV